MPTNLTPARTIEEYIKDEEASGFKVGDKVKILRKAIDNEDGWGCSWIPEMDKAIGEIGTISKIYSKLGQGIQIDFNDPTLPLYYAYPYFVLEKVEERKIFHTYCYDRSAALAVLAMLDSNQNIRWNGGDRPLGFVPPTPCNIVAYVEQNEIWLTFNGSANVSPNSTLIEEMSEFCKTLQISAEWIGTDSTKVSEMWNSICPTCGSKAYSGFSDIKCSNSNCERSG